MSNSIEVLSAVHGIAPRSDELLRLGGDVERGRAGQSDYDELLAVETEKWLDLQRTSGINLLENGKLRWQDHLRPIVKATSGFVEGIDDAPVTRWFKDNRFYRQPTITGPLCFDPDRFDEAVGWPGEQISLLAPGTFAELCVDQYPELPAERNVFQLYSEVVFHLGQQGVKQIVFEDYHTPVDSLIDTSLIQVEMLVDWEPGINFSLLSPGRDRTVVPMIAKPRLGVEVTNHTIDFLKNKPRFARPELKNTEIWQQTIDSSTTAEDQLSLGDYPIEALRRLKPAWLVLTNSVDFEELPLTYAQAKVRRLGEFTQQLADHFKEAGL